MPIWELLDKATDRSYLRVSTDQTLRKEEGTEAGSWHTAIHVDREFGLGLDMPTLRSARDVSDWIRAMVPEM